VSYVRGRRFEYYVMKKLEDLGYYVVRSAGSHGTFDLIAIKNGAALGIQCKLGNVSRAEKDKIVEVGRRYGITPCLATKRNGKVVVIDLLSGESVL